jgi:hypothetical protein
MSKAGRWIVVLTVVTALGRAFITPRLTHIPNPELSYEAFAHLFCGALIGIHLYDRSQKLYGYLGWGLAFWELGWFVVQKAIR